MSSSSSSSRLQLVANNPDDNKCDCEYERYERTSWTPQHPARCFWNCPHSLVTNVIKYKFFLWKDNELFDNYYKGVIMRLKGELDRKENPSEVNRCRRKIHELEVIRSKEKFEFEKENFEMEKVLMEVRGENARLRRIGELMKKLIMVLVVILGVCVIKIWFGLGRG